jgi:hypothetical protein
MGDRRLEGLVRLIDKRKAGDKGTADSMIDLGEVSDVSGSAGEVPTCTVDGDDADVFEPYGLAGQAASGDALVFAPGGDVDSLTVLVSSVAGRPATEPGDKALWTAGGHVVYLDDDGDLTVTGKGGGTVVINGTTGAISVNAGTGVDVSINVDALASVLVGDGTAVSLLKALATQNFLAQAIAFVLLPGNFIPNDGGFKAFQSFLAYITGTPPAPPGGLANAAETAKAKGT